MSKSIKRAHAACPRTSYIDFSKLKSFEMKHYWWLMRRLWCFGSLFFFFFFWFRSSIKVMQAKANVYISQSQCRMYALTASANDSSSEIENRSINSNSYRSKFFSRLSLHPAQFSIFSLRLVFSLSLTHHQWLGIRMHARARSLLIVQRKTSKWNKYKIKTRNEHEKNLYIYTHHTQRTACTHTCTSTN